MASNMTDNDSNFMMNFNQDFTSILVVSKIKHGYWLYNILGFDGIQNICTFDDNEEKIIVETLFDTSLIVFVTKKKPNCLTFKKLNKRRGCCRIVYGTAIQCVRINRQHLIVCLEDDIYIHDIHTIKILHTIKNKTSNKFGLCSLSSLNSYLAYHTEGGELSILNIKKLKAGITLRAHNSKLAALNFSPDGTLLATASEFGTVIKVFCVKNGQKVQELRRGRQSVQIASLVFSPDDNFLCASSNTSTVHIFKINDSAVVEAQNKPIIDPNDNENSSKNEASATIPWTTYFTRTVSSRMPQDRAFAKVNLETESIKKSCLTLVNNRLRLLVTCGRGFLYIYEINSPKFGECTLLKKHNLGYYDEEFVQLNLSADSSTDVIIYASSPSNGSHNDSYDSISSVPEINECPSYADALKGSNKTGKIIAREISDAINTPAAVYDQEQFPPVDNADRH